VRLLVVVLAAANLALLGYILVDRWPGGDRGRFEQQVEPDRIRLLTPQQVAALGPAKAAELPNVCLEWGPFSDRDRDRAVAILEPFRLGSLASERRVEVQAAARSQASIRTLWVVRDPQPGLLERVRDAAIEFSGAAARIGPCPDSQ
jgi:hypothetical protein